MTNHLRANEMICINPKCRRIMSTDEIVPICDRCTESLSAEEFEALLDKFYRPGLKKL